MKQNEIIESIVNALSIENTKIIKTSDFTTERESNMVIVGIDKCQRVYPQLPDYEYQLSVVIDCWIADDENAAEFERIKAETQAFFNEIVETRNFEIFGEIPVVGFLENGIDESITAESNRAELNFLIYASF